MLERLAKIRIVADFQKFALRGNLIELAVGFTVGAAFTTIARSLVDDIIMPPISLLLGDVDFSNRYVVLRAATELPEDATLAQAQAAEAITLNYGLFINNVVAFLLVAFAMFLIIRVVNKIDEQLDLDAGQEVQPGVANVKKCPHCLSSVPYKATRCAYCTSTLGVPAPQEPPV